MSIENVLAYDHMQGMLIVTFLPPKKEKTAHNESQISLFQMPSVEMTTRDREKDSEGYRGKAGDAVRFLTAEQCLAAMKSRIKNIHGVS